MRAEQFRALRKAMDLSLIDVGNAVGLSESMICQWELGHRNLSAKALTRLDVWLSDYESIDYEYVKLAAR